LVAAVLASPQAQAASDALADSQRILGGPPVHTHDRDAMGARASQLAPNSTEGIWRSDERFFRAGGLGAWRDIFTQHELRR
jgi:hypothetical protein